MTRGTPVASVYERCQRLFGRGLLSDDTEHTSMVARALAESSGDLEGFTTSLARQLRRWMLSVPPGVGFATARGTLRLLLGVSPGRSGVFSAGNGPAMRSALLGVCARDDEHLVDLVRASTRGLPSAWVEGLADWPLTVPELRRLAHAIVEGAQPPRQRWLAAIPRNIAFTLLLFGHVGLRLLGR